MMTQMFQKESPGFHPVPGWAEDGPVRETVTPARPLGMEAIRPPLAFPGGKRVEPPEPRRPWRRAFLAVAFAACVIGSCVLIALFRHA